MKPKLKQEEAFLIELPHAVAQIALKRRYLLRSYRTNSVQQVAKTARTSWLRVVKEASLGGKTGWSFAYLLAEKIKHEFRQEAYVEPAHVDGRLKDILSPRPKAQPMKAKPFQNHAIIHNDPFRDSVFLENQENSVCMPKLPTFESLLPPEARESLELFSSQSRLCVSVLRETTGWLELEPWQQKMFEVEAALTLEQLYSATMSQSQYSRDSLTLLLSAGHCSEELMKFLLKQI